MPINAVQTHDRSRCSRENRHPTLQATAGVSDHGLLPGGEFGESEEVSAYLRYLERV